MAKIRIYKLAKELGLENTDLVERARALNIQASNHMSSLSDEDADLLRSECAKPVPQSLEPDVHVKEIRIQPGVIRRRRTVEVKPPPPEPEAVVEAEEPVPDTSAQAEPDVEDAVMPESGEAQTIEESSAQVEARDSVEEAQVPSKEAPIAEKEEEPASAETTPAASDVVLPVEPASVEDKKPPVEGEAKPDVRDAREKKSQPVARKKGAPVTQEPQEEDNKKPVGRKRKVVEYKGRKRRDSRWGGDGNDADSRTPYEMRRERRPARRAPQKPVITTPKSIKRKVKMGESITVGELAKRLSIKSSEIIKQLMMNGIMATINQQIDRETAVLIASEHGYEVENIEREESQLLPEVQDRPEQLTTRPPVVTIMGHVNHGKTRLLDAIRKTNVMEKEAGGITQHIGAYTVKVDGKTIVFLDTPGHEAFTKMRARGAGVTDIVVLVVAGDDGVMPQTVEAINHAKAAKVPIIGAVNKIDLPNANVDRSKQALSEHGLVPEDWGGDTLYVSISAKEGIGIQELLENILLQSEMLEQKANPDKPATGVIVEARLDRTLGPVATVLVQSGTLRVGDPFVTGICYGRVRALINDKGDREKEAGPSIPVEVLGWSAVPEAGDVFYVVEDEKKAKLLSSMRQDKARQAEVSSQGKMSLDDLYDRIRQEEMQDLNIILKGDVQGSIEALGEALTRLSNQEVTVKILHSGVGGVTETDVMLASASNAIIIAFNVRAESKALGLLEQEQVDARFYTVIYDAVSDLKAALAGMMKPVFKEVLLGHAEVRETFSISRVGTIAGSHVLDGKIERNASVRILRDNVVVHDGKLASLRRFKDDVKEVSAGYECGIRMENFNDVKLGDILESYIMEKVAPQADVGGQSDKRPA